MLLIKLQKFLGVAAFCLIMISCQQNLSGASEQAQNSSPPVNKVQNSVQTEFNANKEKPQIPDAAPTEKILTAKNGQCAGDTATRPSGVPETVNLGEQTTLPETAAQFNDWLADLFGTQLVVDQRFADISIVGDFNGDGCNDVAVPVTPDKNYETASNVDSPATTVRSNRNFDEYLNNFVPCGLSVVNLQNNASEITCAQKKSANSKQITSPSPTAVLIIYGGKKGWNWKTNADGRAALLLNGMREPNSKTGGQTEFNIVSKGSRYKEYSLPTTAQGDGLYLGFQSVKGGIIYFDGSSFRLENL